MSMWPGTTAEAIAVSPFPRFSSGCSRSRLWPIAAISAFACAIVVPGRSRPPISSQTARRLVSMSAPNRGDAAAVADIGSHASLRTSVVP